MNRYDSVAALTTNSPIPPSATGLQLRSVSFSPPSSGRLAGQNRIVMGLEPAPLKNEKGARFRAPPGEIVDTNATGRGTMQPMSSL